MGLAYRASRAVKALCTAGIFTKESDGRLVMSPAFGWRGKVSEHKKALTAMLVKDTEAAIEKNDGKI
jgi:hypothetical protein